MSNESKFMDDLWLVGKSKCLGYLPIHTIESAGYSVAQVCDWAEAEGLRYKAFSPNECNIMSGALFVYHRSQLQKLIDANRMVLIKGGWPDLAAGFVGFVASTQAEDEALYELVGIAFNDPRFKESTLIVNTNNYHASITR